MKGTLTRTPYCCGLFELGNFDGNGYNIQNYTKTQIRTSRYATICVTRWSDVKQKLFLRSTGFKRVGRWKNPNTGRVLTLWARFPKKEGK